MSGHVINLLQFSNYDDYVDSFITPNDFRYIRNIEVIRKQVRNICGTACHGPFLSRVKFTALRNQQINEIHSSIRALELFSDRMSSKDPVVRQFAKREKLTLTKHMSCIVFLDVRSEAGLEISGYIDLGSSFSKARRTANQTTIWPAIFRDKALLRPKKNHLSYWDRKKNLVVYNDSENFRQIFSGNHSLLYMDRGDHKVICINAGCDCKYSKNAKRTMHWSPRYGHAIFFDHKVRRMH